MPDERYIWIARWKEFQHYRPDPSRGPAWIKDYTAQLDDVRYLRLTDRQRALLRDLRDIFATFRGRLPDDVSMIARQRNTATRQVDLETLNDAGFIDFLSREALEDALEDLYSDPRGALESRAPARSQEGEAEKSRAKGRSRREDTTHPASERNGLPFAHELGLTRLLTWVAAGRDADDRTAAIIRSRAEHLSEGALAKVIESCEARPRIAKRAAYAVGALNSETASRPPSEPEPRYIPDESRHPT